MVVAPAHPMTSHPVPPLPADPIPVNPSPGDPRPTHPAPADPLPARPAPADPRPADDDRLARAALSRLVEPDDADLRSLLAVHPARDVWAAILGQADGVPPALLGRIRGRLASIHPDRDLERIAMLGGRLLCPGDGEWPSRFHQLALPPLALWVRGPGSLREITERSVAIVGARAATGYGVHVAGELAASLGEHGWSIVSGGAYGIDGAAHRGCIAVGQPTVATLACGVEVVYPSGHAALFARIIQDGLLISEWPPGCSPMRHRFLVRNRLLGCLTLGTVVVEAAVRSGARRTANEAALLGRPVMAVPGPVTSPLSVGCHVLLREGATCVTSAAEVVEAVSAIGDGLVPDPVAPSTPRDSLDPVAQRVLDATPKSRPAPPEDIAATAGLATLDVVRQLARLVALGFAEHVDGEYRLTPAATVQPRRTAPDGPPTM